MNWMGGHLVQFKRKRLSKKAEERRRIEEYIVKRQKKEIMAGGQDFNRQETSSSTEPLMNQQNLINHTEGCSTSANFMPKESVVKHSVDPALLANPWAGIDPNFLKPKVFPSYLKNTPKLYFDAAEGNFTTKPAEISSIRDNSHPGLNFGEESTNGTQLSSQYEDSQYGVYGPVLPPIASEFSSQSSMQSYSSYHSIINHTSNFDEPISDTVISSIAPINESNHDSLSNNENAEESFSKFSPKKNICFNSFASQNQWNFEEEEGEDYVLFDV